jgi:hypothetical protein
VSLCPQFVFPALANVFTWQAFLALKHAYLGSGKANRKVPKSCLG